MEKVVTSIITVDKIKCNVTSVFKGSESLKDLLINIAQSEMKKSLLTINGTDKATGLLYNYSGS